ncbi:DUF4843 domain-containing protein [Niastella sp. OAS944]|uniref:DUF4843 domain-containing protein n=1 Tax=Niastella sp. OAS944 TaxID=2664089 RepID=UPI00348AD720|nr:hypothetical protein [Chitinophagaceae bacterium OAS944]
MKKYSVIIVILLAIATGCKKADYQMYNEGARIQVADTTTLGYTFIYKDFAVTRDTVYVQMNTIGGITDYDRAITIEQIPEYDIIYTRDPATNKVIDSTIKEKPFKAVAGTHYIPFTDAAVQSMMVVKKDSAVGKLPIILLRDTSLRSNSYRLRIKLVANDAFGLGEVKTLERTIVFSDQLERFESWKTDQTSSPAFQAFGKYSTGKHQFMIDVLKVKIDEEWYKAIVAAAAISHYKNLLRDELAAFNANPANIASGKSPVRETSDPTSPIITFPN